MDSSDFAKGLIVGLIVAVPLVWLFSLFRTQAGMPPPPQLMVPTTTPILGQPVFGQRNEEVQDIERDAKGFIKRIVIHREVKNL